MNLKYVLIFCCVGLLINCGESTKKSSTEVAIEEAVQYADLEGNVVSLKSFKGQKVLLNFWATWCIPCLKEMPSMANAQRELQNENFVFLFATTDAVEKINEFKQKNNYPFQYLQFNSSLDKLNIYALPATFLYNSQGKLVKRIDGATEWDSEEMLNLLRAIR